MTLEGHLEADVRAQEVGFALTVTNDGDGPVDLEFRNAQTADFAVLQDGEEVWRHGEGMMFAQMLQQETLEPGEAVTYEGIWDDPTPGDYEVVGTLEASNADVEVRSQFSV